jgi:hypothetical protein
MHTDHDFNSLGGGTDFSRPISGAPPTGGAPETDATGDLLEEVRKLLDQGRPLALRAGHLAQSHAALGLFLLIENVRLFVARYAVTLGAVVMFAACWIFLSIFLWIGVVELTRIWASGPMLLLLTHAIAGWLFLVWRERLTL